MTVLPRAALVTLPALMQEAHTDSRRGVPPTSARILWMLGFQRRLFRRWEWLTLMPKDGCFPQTSQTDATADQASAGPERARAVSSAAGTIRHGWGHAKRWGTSS